MNLQSKLKDLDANNCGDYWIVRCPTCGHKEAYIYVDDIEKYKKNKNFRIPIRCNRLNKCGAVNYIDNIDIDKIPVIIDDEIIGIKQSAIDKINDLASLSYLLKGFDFDWRGISNWTLKVNGVIYLKDGLISFMKGCGKGAFADKYFKKRCYRDRDIIFPIKDYDDKCERLLLRSTKQLDEKSKKEIGLRLKRKSSEVWNRKDLVNPEMPIIFVTEGVPDALSIKEVSQNIGVVALPGVRKYKQLLKEIEKSPVAKSKKYILCFDNDKAGQKYLQKLAILLESKEIKFDYFILCKYKDLNDFLINDRVLFFKSVENYAKIKKSFYRFYHTKNIRKEC